MRESDDGMRLTRNRKTPANPMGGMRTSRVSNSLFQLVWLRRFGAGLMGSAIRLIIKGYRAPAARI